MIFNCLYEIDFLELNQTEMDIPSFFYHKIRERGNLLAHEFSFVNGI